MWNKYYEYPNKFFRNEKFKYNYVKLWKAFYTTFCIYIKPKKCSYPDKTKKKNSLNNSKSSEHFENFSAKSLLESVYSTNVKWIF